MNMKKFLSMLLAFFMLTCAFSLAEETSDVPAATAEEATIAEPAETNPVIATLRDYTVTLEDVTYYAQQLYSEGMIQSATDYAAALDYLLIYNALPTIIVEEKGVENLLSAERIEELYEEAKVNYENEINSYIAYYYGSDISEEDHAYLYDLVVAAYAEQGFPLEEYQKDYLTGEAFGAYFDTFTFDITEEKVLEVFNDFAATDKDLFEGDIVTYEYYTNYYGYSALYQPAGYRGITHILIDADADALTAYAEAAEGGDADEIESAKNAVIESCKEKLDEIYGKIEAGESFESLINEYNTDPGMSGDNLKNGYAVHKDTVVFMQEFTDGAFSEKMQKVGDVSDPVVTSYGVHILYYLRDIPAGNVELTDELYEDMYNYILYSEQDALLRQWLSEYGVEYTAAYADMMG